MSANSIAKLAVIITGDTGQLNQAMDQGTQSIRQFAHQAEHAHGGALGALASGLKVGVQGMHAFEGSTRGIIHTLHNLAGPTGIALVAAAGLGVLAYKSIEAADAMREARNKIGEDYAKAFEAATGTKANFAPEATVSDAWKELKSSVADFFATIAERTGIVDGLIGLMKTLAEAVKGWADYWKTADMKARETLSAWKKEQLPILEAQAKAREEQKKATEDAEKARQRQLDETKRHAEQLMKALRTPDEIYRDTIVELKSLGEQGFVTGEMLSRGMQKAQDDLQRALDLVKQSRDIGYKPVAAVERQTMAGFSAVQSARMAQDNAAKAAAEKTAKNSEFLKHLQSIDANLSKPSAGPTLVVSNL